MTKSKLVHKRVCVWARLSAHMCVSFHLTGKSDRRTCGNVFGEMEAVFIGGGEEGSCKQEPFSRHPEKRLPPRLFFLGGSKIE